MTHSSGRVFIILWARALCFLALRLTTVSLDVTFKEHEVILQVHWNDVSIQIILSSRAVCSYISKDNCNIVLLCIPIILCVSMNTVSNNLAVHFNID